VPLSIASLARSAGRALRALAPAFLAALFIIAAFAAVAASWPALAGPRAIALRHVSLDLPGAPMAVVPTDLDGDGRLDLLIASAFTEWDRIGISRIEDLVEITTVVPVLWDRRDLRAFLATPEGDYRQAGPPLPLPAGVLSLEAGPGDPPAIALTDEGISAVRLHPTASERQIALEPLIADPPVLAGAGSFLADLELMHDLDGDGDRDLLLPARDGAAVYLDGPGGLSTSSAARLDLPGDRRGQGATTWRSYPMARAEDVNGDGHPDLVVRDESRGDRAHVLPGRGDGTFDPPILLGPVRPAGGEAVLPRPAQRAPSGGRSRGRGDDAGAEAPGPRWGELAYLGDVDGSPGAELVTRTELETENDKEEAEKPPRLYRFHHVRKDFTVEPAPYAEHRAIGHSFSSEIPGLPMEEFQDLDGDGRKDLVTITFDVGFWQMVRVMTTKKISIGLGFRVSAQGPDGRFTEVSGQNLEEKLLIDLNRLKLGSLAHFAGDFDGDGIREFVRLGGGKKVPIHRGLPGGRYPRDPDLTVVLDEAPGDLALIRIRDLDGDRRADLMVTRPLPPAERGMAPTVRLDLYLSGGTP